MSKLCFNISNSTKEPPKPIFPSWFQVGLFGFIMWSWGTLIVTKFLGQ